MLVEDTKEREVGWPGWKIIDINGAKLRHPRKNTNILTDAKILLAVETPGKRVTKLIVFR